MEFFNSFTVKKVNFFTINVKIEVVLSSKSGGGDVCTGHPPHPKMWGGGGGGIHPPIPPGFTPVGDGELSVKSILSLSR